MSEKSNTKKRVAWNKGVVGMQKHTEETKKRIGVALRGKAKPWLLGKPSWNKGTKLSKEGRLKLSIAHKGQKPTEEAKRKMSENASRFWLGKKKPPVSLESRKRYSEAHKGKKHWNWQDGLTPLNKKIRNSLELKLWRKACMERDNFTDQKTGIRGGDLVVHHINNFADFPELRTSIDNGITLSIEAHRAFHKKYGNKNNTREQMEEFLGRPL